MWKAIKKFIQKLNQTPVNEEENEPVELVFKKEISVDELFATNFNAGGGHFLYCSNPTETIENLKQIIQYERIRHFVCIDESLQNMLDQLQISYQIHPTENSRFNFLKCEYLIGYDGSIMLSSDQTAGRKIEDFPDNFIIYATPDQLVHNISEALHRIRSNKSDRLPNNITCIRGENMHNFDSIPNAKNIYLLLVEE
ncbi:hypothetical protein [Weeksella virosa]|uniref:LUD domain-containing protein n=1 Tax=Weeksella virosa (strain ATCC 43766 / DSM 16922 / JCM 21250 / CCUG 30538 / CDC 9751 / IAM 14551 / NBRC 16016 / NCTC 11634 / CL345/78) TaxID=865938 RepID=F0NZC6_WEEVC|nr:hypothetical protein [Weeksella virosa]ADX67255.1 hypothetical protein Weevi_0536 [Weeksella virosa DSM 16922]MDK7675897.1 hypothetical protein [Weeksella virosa]SUP53524.1 Uncharacterised protein [Weeksella virosa]VEH63009.1 Uncharacterised protein [Weeksella virosa]